MLLLHDNKCPVAINVATVELVIDKGENGCMFYFSYRYSITVKIPYKKIKVHLPETFIEVNSPSFLDENKDIFTAMLNTKLISTFSWDYYLNPGKYGDLLIYPDHIPKGERWCEDKIDKYHNFIGVIMFSGGCFPLRLSVVELLKTLEIKKLIEKEITNEE